MQQLDTLVSDFLFLFGPDILETCFDFLRIVFLLIFLYDFRPIRIVFEGFSSLNLYNLVTIESIWVYNFNCQVIDN